ncbi:MAG: hypothetical protein ACPG7F_22225, partial [Aggregatilineales bacterium]
FTIGEFGLVFAVVYHALNGLRIVVFDWRPDLWEHQERAAWGVLGGTVLLLVPSFLVMGLHAIDHYQAPELILPLSVIIGSQIPFIVGMAVAAGVALGMSVVYGLLVGEGDSPAMPAKNGGSVIERFWWSYMRISGVLILFLVFGHLIGIHLIQGVFDITAAGYPVVFTDAINVSGTATEFVQHRWAVAFIRIWDIGLLVLAGVHGFNGLRYVLTDYTMDYPVLRRASVFLCIIGAVVLLTVGGAALLSTIDETHIEMAMESMEHLREAYGTD